MMKVGIGLVGIINFLIFFSGFYFYDYNELLRKEKRKEVVRIPTGVCIPFNSRIYMTINGNLYPCERIDCSFVMGNIYDSEVLNAEKIMTLYNQYFENIFPTCAICERKFACTKCLFHIDGIQDLNINFDDELWQLIIALGDEELHDATINQNIQLFFSLCEEKGLISEVKKSEIVKYLNEKFEGIDDPDEMIGIVGGIVVVVAIVAGVGAGYIAGVAAGGVAGIGNFVLSPKGYHHGDSSAMMLRDPQAYQLWILKNGMENTQIILMEYQEKIINDCIDIVVKYFPEKAEKMDLEKLRLLIALNLPK